VGEVEFGLVFVGAFNDGVDDVGLAAGSDMFAEEGPDIIGAGVRGAAGGDGGAAGWELVDDRDVEVAVQGEGKGSRDGGGGHDEGVGLSGLALLFRGRGPRRFLHQAEALLDTKAVLLIDDDEAEFREGDGVVEEGVGADGEVDFAVCDAVASGAFGGFVKRAGEEGDAVRFAGTRADGFGEEFAGGEVMLGREDLGWRHESDLGAVFNGDEGGLHGDDGLSRPDVALKEAPHGLGAAHVGGDFAENAFLGGGGVEGEDLFEGTANGLICNERGTLSIAKTAALEFEAELEKEELLKDEAAMGGGGRGDEVEHGRARFGEVNGAEGGKAGWEVEASEEGLRKGFEHLGCQRSRSLHFASLRSR